MTIPFVAVGANELGASIGDKIECPHCGATHDVKYGERILEDGTRVPSTDIGFYTCDGRSYLCAVRGRSVMHKFQK